MSDPSNPSHQQQPSLSSLLNKPRVHFGSIQETEHLARLQLQQKVLEEKGIDLDTLMAHVDNEEEDDDDNDNNNKHTHLPITTDNAPSNLSLDQKALLADLARKKLAKTIAVPTEDAHVRIKLRELGEPITLFGEGPAERRDRLRELMMKSLGMLNDDGDVRMEGGDDDQDISDEDASEDSSSDEEEITEEFFTIGTQDLLNTRLSITHYSLPKAKSRIQSLNHELTHPVPIRRKIRHEFYTDLKTFSTYSAQIADERPLSFNTFAPNSQQMATGSFSGLIKTWEIPSCNHLKTYRGHNARVSGIDWHPDSTLSLPESSANFVSCDVEGKIYLWSLDNDTPISSLIGHEQRVSRVGWHPSGKWIGSTSFDGTWRLWDAERGIEVLLQEGHSREVYALGFHPDGSLIGTAGFDSLGRIWDLRTGRSILTLQSHIKPILSLDFNPNGYTLCTGSEDNTIKIWDMRMGKSTYTIPAHTNLVSLCKWYKSHSSIQQSEDSWLPNHVLNGSFLVSSSYDGTCRIWSENDWKPLKSLAGLEGKVMCVDVSRDGRFVATASYDRTFRVYASENIAV